MMINIGAMIGERYEIIEKIGTGGMADVYRAKDHRLNRFVAVKILKNEYILQQGEYPVINSGRDIQGFYNKYNVYRRKRKYHRFIRR